MNADRKIIHVDMDAFYASVEQRDFPEYRGKPVIVGGKPDSRGVVAACSYEARRFGIHSAMPSSQVYRLCPQAVFVFPRFEVYQSISAEIRAIFRQFTDMVEPLSLDEAYLDVSYNERWMGSATLIAKEIKSRIKLQTGLTASAGVSYNKFLAKMASGINKPDGLYVIKPDEGEAFVETLPIGKFYGIGKATETRMKQHGIHNGADLKIRSREELVALFGKAGVYYYQITRGIDERPVIAESIRKSISKEITFDKDLRDPLLMLVELKRLADTVTVLLQKNRLQARTITIKVKYADFKQVTRSLTFENPGQDFQGLKTELRELLAKTDAHEKPVRLLGFGVSGLMDVDIDTSEPQGSLFVE
jgi:DNA polymerase-4